MLFEKMEDQAVQHKPEADLWLVLMLHCGAEPELRLEGTVNRRGEKPEKIDQIIPLPPPRERQNWSCEALLQQRGCWDSRRRLSPVAFAEGKMPAYWRLQAPLDLPLEQEERAWPR